MGFNIGGVASLTSPGTTLSVDGASNWMQVNANGVLTRPQTPYMRGQITGQVATYNAGGGPLLVVADVNRGNCWNNATGFFTAPVAGYYLVQMGAIAGNSGAATSGYPQLLKNGVNQCFTHWNHTGSWHYVTITGIILCAAGDTVSFGIFSYSPSTSGVYGGGGGHQMYSIALMA